MTDLTPEQKANALFSIYTSAGLQVVFDLIEEMVTESENALIGEDPENEKAVIKLQYRAHAQRMLFQKLTQKIDYMVRGRDTEVVAQSAPTMEERAQEAAEPIISMQ